jgi:hypothetical protein
MREAGRGGYAGLLVTRHRPAVVSVERFDEARRPNSGPSGGVKDEQAQREDLNKHRGALMIARVSHEELRDAVERVMPTSVFVDGKQVAGSVFVRMLREELGIPIRMPRLIRWLQV